MKHFLIGTALATALFIGGCTHPDDRLSATADNNVKLSEIGERIDAAKYVLIGEKHDNPHHHKVQAAILRQNVSAGDIVVFEMLKSTQQDAIDGFNTGQIAFEELGAALKWSESGWPEWAYYAPLFAAAKDVGATIVAGSLPIPELKKTELDEAALDEGAKAALTQDIKVGHCNLLPEQALAPMMRIQMQKDALMAKKMLTVPSDRKAFLIAGNGHVVKDRAVPRYLPTNSTNTVVVGFAEKGAEADDIYNSYDIYWVTDGIGVTHDEYCADLAKKFGKN
ncbi:MAG: ChaN family lipoprotein [Sneathiella sp.]|nr:ChaN family lipoprotein [Sneathiella sp.]